MQLKWFESINTIHNLYYVIIHNNEKIGLINGAEIDWENGITGNGGIFIWNTDYWSTNIPLLANMLMLDIGMYMGLKKSRVKILSSNTKAIRYNTQMGYRLLPGQENVLNQSYELDEENYIKSTKIIRDYLHKTYGFQIELVIDDKDHPVTQFILQRISKLDDHIKKHFLIHE
jgi:hypothetical protein